MGKTEGIGISGERNERIRLSKCMLVLRSSKAWVLNERHSVRSFRTYTCGDEECLVNEWISAECSYLSG